MIKKMPLTISMVLAYAALHGECTPEHKELLLNKGIDQTTVDEICAPPEEGLIPIEAVTSIKKESKATYEFSGNIYTKFQSDEIKNSSIDSRIDDTAYHFELKVVFDSKKKGWFTKSTHSYFALHATKQISEHGDDVGYDSVETTALIYGHKYYLKERHRGFGYGWYAGVAQTKVVESYTTDINGLAVKSTNPDDYENFTQAVIAAEIFYKYSYENFYIEPKAFLGMNTENQEYSFYPMVMLGVSF